MMRIFLITLLLAAVAHAAFAASPDTVDIDWAKLAGTATSISFGLNGFHAFDPQMTRNQTYEDGLAYMDPGIVRYHNWDMLGDSKSTANGWVDIEHRRWDTKKIKAAMDGAYSFGTVRLINIPGWPSWMKQTSDGCLDPAEYRPFAQWCADLVRIVNVNLKQHVTYWEVTNERDNPYFVDKHDDGGRGSLKDASQPDKVEDLALLYTQAVRAMKAVDPTIRVGGPAAARPDLTEFTTRFVAAAAPELDFYSIHSYASGSASDPDARIYDRANDFGTSIAQTVAILDKASPRRRIPVFFDEYNISWSWEVRDPRMADNHGAVFDALVMARAVTSGAASSMAWNECDGVYGKLDGDSRPRPGAMVYHVFNTVLRGRWYPASGASTGDIVAYGVRTETGKQSILLINRSETDIVTRLPHLTAATASRVTIDAAGLTTASIRVGDAPVDLLMTRNSITVLTYKPSNREGR